LCWRTRLGCHNVLLIALSGFVGEVIRHKQDLEYLLSVELDEHTITKGFQFVNLFFNFFSVCREGIVFVVFHEEFFYLLV